MDNEDFVPLSSADDLLPVSDDVAQLKLEVENWRKKQLASEADFGQKRAVFIELFKQKENELNDVKESLAVSQKETAKLKEEVQKIAAENEDIKTAAAIVEASNQDEIDMVQRKCQEELASLQHIMKDAIAQAHQAAAAKFDEERGRWIKEKDKLEDKLESKSKFVAPDRDGFLSSVTKTLQKRVGAVGLTSALTQEQSEHENLETEMKKAQEDAEILKSVVMPLEAEIRKLKSQLKEARDRHIAKMNGGEVEEEEAVIESIGDGDVEEKVKELNHSLETEKASRTDLEMYVAVLHTQKTVLQEDADKLRGELHEVCKILEGEKREHTDLKRTWQMANDQFLESQRLMMMDMRRMESVLTAEQQRHLGELKKKDAEREAQEKRVRELEAMRVREQQEQEQRRMAEERQRAMQAQVDRNLNRVSPDDSDRFDASASPPLKRSQSNQSFSSLGKDFLDSGAHETRSLNEEAASMRSSPDRLLTEAQQKALTDPTPEVTESQSILASAKARQNDVISMVGRRLVSEAEWQMMQEEVKTAREKLGKSCDMCGNYESQLQGIQENEKKAVAQVRTLERQLEGERQAMTNQQKYTDELEVSLNQNAQEAEKQITTLLSKVQESEKYVSTMKQQFAQVKTELYEHLKSVTEHREEIQRELSKLQEENDTLVGLHSQHALQMQEESIDLPNNLEEMQLLLLKYREEIITVKVAREHTESTLRSEIMFLKDQVLGEQQEKATIEETMSQDINALQEEVATLHSVKSELSRQTKLREDSDIKGRDMETSLKNIQSKSKQLIGALQNQLEEAQKGRSKCEGDVQALKAKVAGLQVDLDNSEAVQRDFVKLSQSLQIQLEKIRASEYEVRWQHDEDADDCNGCKQLFAVTKRKHHCRHCGKCFCADCLTKVVPSGPHNRPSKVCDVCHTILVNDATPYFSTEPPTTPT